MNSVGETGLQFRVTAIQSPRKIVKLKPAAFSIAASYQPQAFPDDRRLPLILRQLFHPPEQIVRLWQDGVFQNRLIRDVHIHRRHAPHGGIQMRE